MSIYIVRPKVTLKGQFPDLTARKITAKKRQAQIQEIAHLWQENSTYQEIRQWIDDAQDYGVQPISTTLNFPTLTGTTLVEMSDDEAERMGRELSNIVILQDRPIDLIRPTRNSTTAKQKLTEGDIWHLQAINRNSSSKTGKNIKIAVFDTGTDSSHPEIQGKIAESYRLRLKERMIEPTPSEELSQDTDGHGTHVVGLICGNTVGVAPEAEIISVAMLPRGKGFLSNFIIGFDWLRNRPDVRIVNISAGLTQPEYIKQMSNEIEQLLEFGILPICAVGNEGRNNTRTPGNCAGGVSVGATTGDRRVAGFSGSATMSLDSRLYNVPSLVAPGAAVYSSVMGGGYEAWNGTSMATPIVSGVAALLLEEDLSISVDDLREALLERCHSLEGVDQERQGKGIIQVSL